MGEVCLVSFLSEGIKFLRASLIEVDCFSAPELCFISPLDTVSTRG